MFKSWADFLIYPSGAVRRTLGLLQTRRAWFMPGLASAESNTCVFDSPVVLPYIAEAQPYAELP